MIDTAEFQMYIIADQYVQSNVNNIRDKPLRKWCVYFAINSIIFWDKIYRAWEHWRFIT